MRSTLTRGIVLAGTLTAAMACGQDSTMLTTTRIGPDSLLTSVIADYPVKLVIAPNPVPALALGATVKLSGPIYDGTGKFLPGRSTVWTTSNSAIATVATDGTVSAKAAGTAIIRGTSASVSTVSDSVVVVVGTPPPSVKTITVALSATSVVTSANAQATATLNDSLGQVLTGRTVTWMSLSPTVATVNATTGLITAVAPGTSTITATNGNVTGSATITVTAPVAQVKTITVALSGTSVVATASAQATATLKDSLGQVLTGRTVTWTSASPTVATVDATTGLITGVAAGTSAITATSGTVTGSATITVTAPVTPSGSEILANLPQVYLNTTMPAAPAAGGKIISVASGGNLQAAINSALPGDVIELANGGTYNGNFTLPNKNTTSTNWIVIRPANMSGVPAEGSRMTASKAVAASLPKVLSLTNQGAFNTAYGAHHFRLVALDVSVPASVANTGLIRLGSSYETTLAQMPHDIVLDRMYIHGSATGSVRRCIALNSASSAIIDSYISDCHETGSDAQAIAGWTGPGPFKIVNNYIEGSGENLIFGGDDPLINGVVPSDIEIRHNHFFKPTSWKGKWLVKNLLEIKNAQRVLIEGNLLENNWMDGQSGSAINLKSVNQTGACPWCVARDVTFRLNLIKNTGSGFNLSGHDAQTPGLPIPMTRVTITDNVMTGINVGAQFAGDGRGFNINNDPIDLVISHNTVPDPTNTAISFGGPTTGSQVPTRLVVRDNIIGGGQYGMRGPGMGPAASITAFFKGGAFVSNTLVATGANTVGFPIGTHFAATLAAIGFVNASALDFNLSASSPFRLLSTDGRDPGANVNAVNSAIAGVIVP